MKKITIGILILGLLMGCSQNTKIKQAEAEPVEKVIVYENENYVDYIDTSDIKTDVESINKKFKGIFSKYVQYKAPNGKTITIIAQDQVTDEQVLKAYNVLSFYLTSHKGYDMTGVANAMADSQAILMMPNGADGDSNIKESIMYGQPLYQLETPVTGDKWYINNDYEHRDASYEEILHMVHDNGIGTSSNPGKLPELTSTIKGAMENALPKSKSDWGKKGLWGYGSKDWLLELSKEGSLEQEYIVSVLDSYYGLWSAFEEKGGMWGIYIAKDRNEIKEKDPMGLEALESFLPEYLTYMDRISPDFEGTFEMSYKEELAYTFKSQYMNKARLTGEKNSNLSANDRDNILMGNKGNNVIDGKDGVDIVQFSGSSFEYEISDNQVKDLRGRDGVDTLKNIEILRFADKDVQFN
ncbi:hypothetical protein EZV73_03155 [Acidaminobacter sp. JC074]|uniref:hypothetical protein n=1 Tax=Acidaminobacter sp. JC074 TaxID=2530199 RepID=UPI001F0E2FE4|nr:hypothetical protein [Acidaminobacter sp. JC074]MCH4886547.1 hypothetical protein [Acidaminobacter sp. JC074]